MKNGRLMRTMKGLRNSMKNTIKKLMILLENCNIIRILKN